ncbi:MAG: beta-lactamase family protein [Cellulophaga sp.]|nr:beta-lactamase family protein [Cellulophaga sp.]
MTKTKVVLVFLFILLSYGCKYEQKQNSEILSIDKVNKINNYLNTESKNTLGLAIAVIKDGTVVYKNYLGYENLNNKPVNKQTIFPLYSLSKLITSTAIFQLIEENKIRLDNNDFIKAMTKDKMWIPFDYKIPFYFENKKDKFLYGWQQYATNNEISYGFTGGLVTGYRKFIHQNMTIIILTNGLKDSPIRNKVINKIASIIDESLVDLTNESL